MGWTVEWPHHAAGRELFVWTVNRRAAVARLRALGVDGVISDDPRVLS